MDTSKKACRRLGIHANTLRRWADAGKIKHIRTPHNQRLYDVDDFLVGMIQATDRSNGSINFPLDVSPKGIYGSNTMRRVLHHFTEGQVLKLKALSKQTGLSVAEHLRRAVDGYLLGK